MLERLEFHDQSREDHERRISALEGVASAIDKLSARFKKYGIAILVALAASGVVSGPWGKFLAELAAAVAK